MAPIVNVRSPICISLIPISIGKHEPSLRQPTVSIGSAGVSARRAPSARADSAKSAVMAGRDDVLQGLPDHLLLLVAE